MLQHELEMASLKTSLNVRRFSVFVFIVFVTILWILKGFPNPFKRYTLRSTTDRFLAIEREIKRMKRKLEDKSRIMELENYTKLAQYATPKVVLGYTTFFGQKPWKWLPNSDVFNHWEGIKCPYFQCRLTYDNKEYTKADAVLFHAFEMPGTFALSNLAKYRPKNQKWIYFALENPDNNPRAVGLDNYFHWKINYRRDSDVFAPYGYYYPFSNKAEGEQYHSEINTGQKDKFVLWTVSHCDLPREDYVRKLLKYIKIDIYGACAGNVGSKPAPGKCIYNAKECDVLKKRYKFQLALENSNCVDYITEKYWKAIDLGIVPVVLGGSGYGKEIAIPGSFIDVMQFKTVKDLADYLTYLDKNDAEYRQYFEWRKTYRAVGSAPWSCTLCAALNIHTKTKAIPNLAEYWSSKKQCGVRDSKIREILARESRRI
ncbi:galactoside 3(4)-L-fucosyltransferase-like [Exaiptasia diaphana]|uniref:Fucosyltransferase n=1 Tax=Exaiptasia diaphana TaxID=2652724 RepID=A0A913X842_EXADI|nr:galactoside 3(4)-L-fucosyltransferase-like [Exaiptasia diaphana]